MDGDIRYIHTTCMRAWPHLARRSSLKGRVDDANDDKNSIAPSKTMEHQPAVGTEKKHPARAHMKR